MYIQLNPITLHGSEYDSPGVKEKPRRELEVGGAAEGWADKVDMTIREGVSAWLLRIIPAPKSNVYILCTIETRATHTEVSLGERERGLCAGNRGQGRTGVGCVFYL